MSNTVPNENNIWWLRPIENKLHPNQLVPKYLSTTSLVNSYPREKYIYTRKIKFNSFHSYVMFFIYILFFYKICFNYKTTSNIVIYLPFSCRKHTCLEPCWSSKSDENVCFLIMSSMFIIVLCWQTHWLIGWTESHKAINFIFNWW